MFTHHSLEPIVLIIIIDFFDRRLRWCQKPFVCMPLTSRTKIASPGSLVDCGRRVSSLLASCKGAVLITSFTTRQSHFNPIFSSGTVLAAIKIACVSFCQAHQATRCYLMYSGYSLHHSPPSLHSFHWVHYPLRCRGLPRRVTGCAVCRQVPARDSPLGHGAVRARP